MMGAGSLPPVGLSRCFGDGDFVKVEINSHLNDVIAFVVKVGCGLELVPTHKAALELSVLTCNALNNVLANLLILTKAVIPVCPAIL